MLPNACICVGCKQSVINDYTWCLWDRLFGAGFKDLIHTAYKVLLELNFGVDCSALTYDMFFSAVIFVIARFAFEAEPIKIP